MVDLKHAIRSFWTELTLQELTDHKCNMFLRPALEKARDRSFEYRGVMVRFHGNHEPMTLFSVVEGIYTEEITVDFGWDWGAIYILTKEGTKVMQDRPLWGLLRTLCRQRNLTLNPDDKV